MEVLHDPGKGEPLDRVHANKIFGAREEVNLLGAGLERYSC